MSNQPLSNGSHDEQSYAMNVVLETIQLSNGLAESVGQAGNTLRQGLGWETETPQDINSLELAHHLGIYEKEIGEHLGEIERLMELLPVADEIAVESLKSHIPPALTVLAALEGETVPANETVETIADWCNSIDDDLDILYAESLFVQVLLAQPEIHAPQTVQMFEGISGLLNTVMPGRERVDQVLGYFE